MIDTIRRFGPLTLSEFNSLWERSSLSMGHQMPRSTFNYNREAIEEIFGIEIQCHKKDFTYYIRNMGDLKSNSLQRWLMDTLSIGTLLADSQILHNRILLDKIPVGGSVLQEILRAMKSNMRIRLRYRKFKDSVEKEVEGAPLCLKASERRWYVVLDTPDHKEPAVYSLDRILSVTQEDMSFTMPKDFDGEAFFQNSYGVLAGNDFPVEHVTLKVRGVLRDYLRSLPLHASQHETDITPEWSYFHYDIRLTFDFIQRIISHGSSLEVISPDSLRRTISDEINKAASLYNKEQA